MPCKKVCKFAFWQLTLYHTRTFFGSYLMPIHIKNKEEIAKMRIAGRLAADVLDMITPYVKAGITTAELDKLCHDYIVDIQKAIPAPLNYRGYPKSICTSINHVICHGIPSDKKLKKGDIINIDITVKKDDYHGDTSRMFMIGEVSALAKKLARITHECLWKAIEIVKPGTQLGDIGAIIQQHAENNHFSVVKDFCGHGIGSTFHEPEIQVLHYGKPGHGLILEPGMTFTIEPMINAGKYHAKVLPDGWTAVTKDHSLSAQWEHTILVTETGFEVFTLGEEERNLILN
jgi:methionyl aminopeptidase